MLMIRPNRGPRLPRQNLITMLWPYESKNTQRRCSVCANTEGRGSMYLIQAIPPNLNNHADLEAVTHASLPQHSTSPPKHNRFHITLSTAKHNTLRPPAISNEVSSYQFHTATKQWTICPFSERQYLLYCLSANITTPPKSLFTNWCTIELL